MKQSIIISIQLFLFTTAMQQSFVQTGKFRSHDLYYSRGWKETKYLDGVQLTKSPAAKELIQTNNSK